MKLQKDTSLRSFTFILVCGLTLPLVEIQAEPGPSLGELRQVRDNIQSQLEQADDPSTRLILLNKLDQAKAGIVRAQRDPILWEVDPTVATEKSEKKNLPMVMVFLTPVELNVVTVNQQRSEIFSDEFRKLAGRAVFLLMEKDAEKDETTQHLHDIFKIDGFPQIVVYDRSQKTVTYRIKGQFPAEALTGTLGERLPPATR